MRVVVDTNVLVSGLVAEGVCRDIVKRYLPTCKLITSPALLNELAETMRDKFGLNPDDLPFLKIYTDETTIVKSESLPKPVAGTRMTMNCSQPRWREKLKSF